MTLTKRLVLLVLPILLIGVLVAAIGVLSIQKDTLIKVEQSRLDLQLLQAKVEFEREANLSLGVVSLLLEGKAFSDFTRHLGQDISAYLVTQRLDYMLNDLLGDNHVRIAITVLDKTGESLYHYERSDNPFSKPSTFLPSFARSLIKKNSFEEQKLMFLKNDAHAYLYGRTLDGTTLTTPVRNSMEDSLALVVTVYMTEFDNILMSLQSEYGVRPMIINRPSSFGQTLEGNTRTVVLFPGTVLQQKLTSEYLSKTRSGLTDWIIATSLGLGLAIATILLISIRKFIIQPIESLDTQLSLLMKEQTPDFNRPIESDEVSRLGAKFYDLYEQLNMNLRKSQALAVTDALTKLPNRTRFQEFAKRVLVRAWNRHSHVSLIYIDLDNFKFVNDRLGHEAGDELLQHAAKAFESLINANQDKEQSALVSRLAGDEFAIVLAHDNLDERIELAKSVVSLFEGGFKTERYITPVSASIGIASYPTDGEGLRELIANADMAMYHAKRTGKNRFAAYSHTIAREARRVKLIEDALKFVNCDEEFSLVFMPFVDKDRKIKGLEVLLRWYSPELGQITPDEFVPIAEQTGTYTKIDDWVFRNAFEHLEKLRSFLGEDIVIAINISAGELGQASFVDRIIELKKLYSVPDCAVELEITETFGYFAVKQVLTVLQNLRNHGFRISIDDFGIGYTPLLQMIDYPVDKVKFDKELVDRLTNKTHHQLMQPTVELCHLQNINVTAEGVENTDKFELLKEAKCDYFQGYSIAQPMTITELRQWHRQYKLSDEA